MHDEQDDLVEDWMAEYDDAVCKGVLPPVPPMGSGVQSEKAGKAVQCLSLLEQVWPRDSSRESHGTVEEGESISPDKSGASDCAKALDQETWPRRIGKFTIVESLGEGGFGIVFRAFDPDLSRDVAIKIPKLGSLLNRKQRSRFQREARLLAQLNHPHLVPVFEAGEADNLAFIVSHLCCGPSLASWIHDQPNVVSCRQAAEMAIEIAEGLDHAHQNNILHRDLKPANVLLDGLTRDGKPWLRIADFGLARLNEEQLDATGSGMLIGTISYMAPEQASGSVDLDCRTDLYSLGVLLYELLIGQPPHRGETQMETLRLVQSREPIAPRRIRPGIPRDLETICLKCLAKERSGRYDSAIEVRDDLQRFLDGKPISAKPTRPIGKLLKLTRRYPFAAALIFALSLLMSMLFVGSIWTTIVVQRKNGVIEREAKRALTAETQVKQRLWESLQLQMSLAAQSSRIGSQSTAKRTLAQAIALMPDLQSTDGLHRLHTDAIRALTRSDFVDETVVMGFPFDPLLPRTIDATGGVAFGCRRTESGYTVYRMDLNSPNQPRRIFHSPVPLAMFAASADGRRLATLHRGDQGASVEVWETAADSESKPVGIFKYPECQAIDISRDGGRLAVATGEFVDVMDVDTDQVLSRFSGNGLVGPVAFDDTAELVAFGVDNRVDVGRVKSSVIQRQFQHENPAEVRSLAWNRKGDQLVVGRSDYFTYVWFFDCVGEPRHQLIGHQESILQTGFLGTQGMVFSAGKSAVTLWEPVRGAKVLDSERECVAIFDSGFLFDDGEHLVRSRIVPSPIRRSLDCQVPNYDAYSIAYSQAGKRIAAGGYDSIQLWTVPAFEEVPGVHCPLATELVFSSATTNRAPAHLMATSQRGIERFNLRQESQEDSEMVVDCDQILGSTAALGPRGESAAWIDLDGYLHRWRAAEGEWSSDRPLVKAQGDRHRNVLLFIDPLRPRAAIIDNESLEIQWVDLDDGEILMKLDLGSSKTRLEFSPDPSIIALVGTRGWSIERLDFESQAQNNLVSQSDVVSDVRFASDMRSIVVADQGGVITWSTWPDLEPIATFDCGSRTRAMKWVDQDSRLITTGEDLKVLVWDLKAMREFALPADANH